MARKPTIRTHQNAADNGDAPTDAAASSSPKSPAKASPKAAAKAAGKPTAAASATTGAAPPAKRGPKGAGKGSGMGPKGRDSSASPSKVPNTFKAFITRYPDLGAAHEKIASAVERAAALDPKTLALVKIGICVGAGLESALRSHVRRAIQHGASRAEVEQAILLGMNTVGFPRTVAAWSWAQVQFERGQ